MTITVTLRLINLLECLRKIDDFGTFYKKFSTVLATTCKHDVPMGSKSTMQNNPWITGGLIVSINHCHDLYKEWVKARKV